MARLRAITNRDRLMIEKMIWAKYDCRKISTDLKFNPSTFYHEMSIGKIDENHPYQFSESVHSTLRSPARER